MTSRTASRAIALVTGLALGILFPSVSPAQYLYLDTDGDGVHTAADVVSPSGSTNIGVWLRTNVNRDGSPAVCSSDDGDLTISSYEVILSAHNGNVSWDALTNVVPQFSTNFGTVASGSDAHVYYGGSSLPAGTYHLANVRISVTSGTPSIEILTSTSLSPMFTTLFGSQCSGLDFDNALKLGSDWFDKDGIPFGGAANQNPVMGAVADMTVAEGAVAEQIIHASDPEGAPLTFVKFDGPAYMTVSTISSGPADPTGKIRLEPDYFSAGNAQGVVGASDGFVATSATFAITVDNTPRAPVLNPVPNQSLAAGSQLHVPISADDPDQQASQILFIAAQPPWTSALTHPPLTSLHAEGELLITPPSSTPAGDYQAILLATKAGLADSALFTIHVTSGFPNSRPYIVGMPDLGVSAGETLSQGFTAFDFDGDPITLSKVSGPSYMSVTKTGQGGGTATGLVTLTPGLADVGGTTGVIGAFDGALMGTYEFTIVVVNPAASAATLLKLAGEPDEPLTLGQSFYYGPIGSQFSGRAAGFGDVNLRVARTGSPGDDWGLWFAPPDSQLLVPGFYTNARRDGGFVGLPGLDISGQGGECASITGLFEIKQIDRGADGALRAFWARFEQHCNGAKPALVGEVRINANADLAVIAPLQKKAVVGEVLTFPVQVISDHTSPITVSVLPSLPEGAEFNDDGAGNATFTWRPTVPLPPTQIVFEARDLNGHVDRSTMLLSVTGPASLTLFSDPGDPVGHGADLAYGGEEIQTHHQDFDPNLIKFDTTVFDGYGPFHLYLRSANLDRITPGVYEGSTGELYHTPGTPTLEIYADGYNPCVSVTGRFDVREATYDANGALESFDAYFVQNCTGFEWMAITGEIRWNAHPPVDVTVPLSRTTREGEPGSFVATASLDHHVSYSIQGLPVGATFADHGDNTARIDWTPDFASSGVYSMRLIATRDDGPSLSIPLRWNVLEGSRPPVANAGGPYEGTTGIPVAFDGSGSFDPDGTPVYLFWDFGDGTSSTFEAKPFHTYAAPGEYMVVLAAYDSSYAQFDMDSTTASIHTTVSARLFTSHGNRDIRLTSGKPKWCVQLEPIRASFNPADIVLSSLALVSDSTSGPVSHIPAIEDKAALVSDTDGNGVPEATVCFTKEDLRRLFQYVSGRSVERVIVQGALANGSRFRAVMQIEVVGANGKTALAATPNPLNPETTLSWYLPSASKVQLRVFDVTGRLVATLADGPAPAGYGSVRWKPDRIASGVYYANLQTENERRSIRLVVLK